MTRLAYDDDLNPAQLEAVRSVDGPHLVVAGAGTGKTRTLVYRVAYLVEQGVPPQSILLLTFTRRAAREMLVRAERLLDARCRRVAGGTFHSFGNTVLRRWGRLLGYEPSFTILDRQDAADLIGILRAEKGLAQRGRRFPRKDTLQELYSKRVNTGRALRDLLLQDYPQYLEEEATLEELGELYAERKKQQNVVDYDDLLTGLRDLLAAHEEVRAALSAAYSHVMVDEYQDTNRLQAHIAALLASGHGNLMVVGDEAQSIYSFRGADFRNIMDFPRLFPECRQILLEQNYRSTQPILDLSNGVLESARESFDKRLFTTAGGGPKPLLVRTPDDAGQSAFVCERILELREEGVPLSEMAVLSRAAWHSNTLEVELGRRNIPFRKYGGIRFAEAAHVKDLVAMLRLALNPLDGSSWFRTLQLLEGVGTQRAQQMTELVIDSGGDPQRAFTTHFRAARYGEGLRRLCDKLRQAGRSDVELPVRIETVVDYYRSLMPAKYDDVKRRERDLDAIKTLAERYDDLAGLLTDLAIEPPEIGGGSAADGGPDDDEWLTVSTVHSAKGLEWNSVFVLHLNNGHFPIYAATLDPESFEEERRLFYVATTRAKRNLFLLRPLQVSGRNVFGGGSIAEISPLLDEVPQVPELVESITYSEPAPEAPEAASGGKIAVDPERLRRIQDYFGD